MLPLLGEPMIEYVLESLSHHGITHATLSLGYLPDRFIDAYPSNIIGNVQVQYAVEAEPLDTAGAIRFAARSAGLNETFLVVNGDVMTDLDVTALVNFHRERGAQATIALHPVEDPSRFGVVPTDDQGRVLQFVEKPRREDAPTNLINAGTYVLEPSVLEQIDPGRPVSVERETFPKLAEAGTLYAMADTSYWLDTGTPAAYIRANVDVLTGKTGSGRFAGIEGAVWKHPHSSVDSSAEVSRSVIDRDCVVGAHAVLDEVILLPGAVVHAGAHIASSIIGPEAVIGTNAKLGPTCVVGAGEHVAAGSELSGDVRLGGV